MKKECIAMLLAGGQGSRLYVLTENMAKPAVPFGGKFRIIDFPLSNCANSGIDTIGVLTQYRPLELNRYIGNGQPWDLDRSDGGVHILPPYQSAKGATWFKGTANAIYQNIGFVDMYDPDYVLILSGDHIYKMDYAAMLAQGSGLNLLDKDWPIYARAESEPPAYLGETAEVDHSVVTRGSEVEGAVRNSVLSQRCTVAEGAEVEYSILMPGAVVERGARVAYAILGENVRVGENARVGASPEAAPPEEWGITVVGPEAQVEAGRTLKANRMLNREGKETVR